MIKISVIIPAYNCEKNIGFLLNSLRKQSCPQSSFEVIIVDDGSTDDTAFVVKKYPVAYFKQTNKGPGAARNLGAAKARGQILLFVDSDVIVPSGWIRGYLKRYQGIRGRYIIGGGVKKPRENGVLAWADFLASWDNAHEDMGQGLSVEYLPTLNLSVEKEVFLMIGGFWNRRLSGEDVDFCFRARQQGVKIIFDGSLAVWHTPHTLRTFLSHNFNWGYHAPFVRGDLESLNYHFLFKGGFWMSLVWFFPVVLGWISLLLYHWWRYQPLRFASALPLIFLAKFSYGLGTITGSWQKEFGRND